MSGAMNDPLSKAATATEIAGAVMSGKVKAAAVIDATLKRIAASEPSVNAFTDIVAERARKRAAEIDAGRAAFAAARAAFAEVIAPYDALLTPSAPGEAPEGIAATGDPAFNSLWTLLHVPCVTVPVATGPKGLPLGVQVVTGFGQDRACLAWGEWVRQAVTGG